MKTKYYKITTVSGVVSFWAKRGRWEKALTEDEDDQMNSIDYKDWNIPKRCGDSSILQLTEESSGLTVKEITEEETFMELI